VGCLTITDVTNTHEILQAAIVKLCLLATTVTTLSNNLSALYSANGVELDAYIANYLQTNSTSSTLQSNKMVPYVAYEFYGALTGKFDAAGVGLAGTDWVDIYICNGTNGTPDKRGRVAIGATDSPGPAFTDPLVNPAISGNPTWSASPGVWTKFGNNAITLTLGQIPDHTHTATSAVSVESHSHYTFNIDSPGGSGAPGVTSTTYATVNHETDDTLSYRIKGTSTSPTLAKTSVATSALTSTITVNSTSGGGAAHSNIQPGIAAYYIMFIP
jgi:microcystin-dependent protein